MLQRNAFDLLEFLPIARQTVFNARGKSIDDNGALPVIGKGQGKACYKQDADAHWGCKINLRHFQ
jgi:hypothetical protein